jgi:hypothetical protein
MPLFKHDHCVHCQFHSTVDGIDIWHCTNSNGFGGSLIARHGNEPCEYGSIPVDVFVSGLKGNIQLSDGSVVTYRDFIDHHAPAYYKVWEEIVKRLK